MTVDQVMTELAALGNPQTVKIYRNHGAPEDMFGVKIGDLKMLLKKLKGDQTLAMELWDTGNSDAMYLASLLANGGQMTRKQLQAWAKSASWHMLSEYAVPFVAAEHPDALAIAGEWIDSKRESIVCSGWCTYASAISIWPDDELNLDEIRGLLRRVEAEISGASDRVRYCMNGFVIAVGSYVKPLLRDAKATARRIGKVECDMGNTSCKVPLATEVIGKIESMGRVGKKRKSAKC